MKNKFDKFAENCQQHPIRNFAILFVILVIVPTGIIHLVYNIPVHNVEILKARIPAGNLLAYIGTVLTFCATFMLSMTVYLSNKEQSKKMQIAENKAILIVNEEYDVTVSFPDSKKTESEDLSVEMQFNILSDAPISKMKIKYLSINDIEYPDVDDKKFVRSYEDGKDVNFQYKERMDKAIVSFELKDKRAQEIFRKSDKIDIEIDMDVFCDNVKTEVIVNASIAFDENDLELIAYREYYIISSKTFCHNANLC